MEIERKYLVKYIPELAGAQKKEIEQGYLCRQPVFRIRKANERYLFTFKSKVGLSQENAIQNDEVERQIPKEAYEHLRTKVDGGMLAKTRYVLPLPDGHVAELDIFGGKLEGLVFVEVEFEDEEAAIRFEKPEWFGDDVSAYSDFSNAYLSTVEDYAAWKREWEAKIK